MGRLPRQANEPSVNSFESEKIITYVEESAYVASEMLSLLAFGSPDSGAGVAEDRRQGRSWVR